MCGKKSKSPWLLLAALFFLSSGSSWAEELTESQLYLLAGEVSAEMKKAGLEEERAKLRTIFGFFTDKFKLLEDQSASLLDLSKTQEAMLTDLQNQLEKAQDKVTSLQQQLPMLEDKVKQSETSLANEIEDGRWDFVKGAGIGVVAGSVLVFVISKLSGKE